MKKTLVSRIGSCLIIFIAVVNVWLHAQTSETPDLDVIPQSDDLEKPIISEEYVLMPGDRILVTITGGTNYSYTTNVTFEGKVAIELPVGSSMIQDNMLMPQYEIIKTVHLYGLTLKQAKDSLKTVFLQYFRNTVVDITLIGMRRFTIFIAGEVTRPGMFSARPVDRVSVIVQRAGGVTTMGSRSNIQIYRQGEITAIANLELFEETGDRAVNPYVKDGDVIIVSRMKQSVIVKGAVFGRRGYELRVAELTATRETSSQGLYELIDGERVLDLINKAGGLTPWADAINTYVKRGDDKLYIDLTAVLQDPQHPDNIELQDGDELIIPSGNTLVYVQGQVVNPAAFPFEANFHASDYIGIAGGALEDANMSGAYLIRGNEKISLKQDPVVQAGDRIHVPRQIFKFWQDYVEIGAVIASLIISYLTLTSN